MHSVIQSPLLFDTIHKPTFISFLKVCLDLFTLPRPVFRRTPSVQGQYNFRWDFLWALAVCLIHSATVHLSSGAERQAWKCPARSHLRLLILFGLTCWEGSWREGICSNWGQTVQNSLVVIFWIVLLSWFLFLHDSWVSSFISTQKYIILNVLD